MPQIRKTVGMSMLRGRMVKCTRYVSGSTPLATVGRVNGRLHGFVNYGKNPQLIKEKITSPEKIHWDN